jgi:hypothetical protein
LTYGLLRPQEGVEGAILTPRMYKELAKNVCPLPLSDVKKNYQVTEGTCDTATQTPPTHTPFVFSCHVKGNREVFT